jgi:two-component system, NarL family, sensor kinase
MTTARPAGTPPRTRPDWVRLVDGSAPVPAAPQPPTARRVLTRFVVGNVVAVALLMVGIVWASGRAAESESLADARTATDLLATVVVQPALPPDLATADDAAVAAFDARVRPAAAAAGLVRVKIWSPDGVIVYSDEPRLIGLTFPLREDETAALRTGRTASEVSDLDEPENRFERSQGELVEVYRRVAAPGGEGLLFETYSGYDDATSRQVSIFLTFAPISATALLLLLLVQLPLADRMIRQLRDGERERLELLARAADASSDERRRIAGSLHDGIVQDLSAASLIISGSADGGRVSDESALRAAGRAVRESVTALRSLLIEIYPPHLAGAGLPSALQNLVSRLLPHGVVADVDVPDDLDAPDDVAALVFRVAQEALINIARHARAQHVTLSARHHDGAVELVVTDDGAGFDADRATHETGHFGLSVLVDLAREAGATLDLATAPGAGTSLRLRVPVP